MIPTAGRRVLSMIKIWRFSAQPPASAPKAKSAPPKPSHPLKPPKLKWYSVSLVPGKRCCLAVKQLARKRWLSADAPRFPVAKCDMKTCECRYQHHDDRRGTPRRRVDREALPRSYEGDERRASRRERRRPDK
jgi:hypothetical protein